MSAEENKAVIRRLFEEVANNNDHAVLEELVAEDVVDHAATEEHKRGIEGFEGTEELRWYEAEVLMADLSGHRHTMRGSSEAEIVGRMRGHYPGAVTILAREEKTECSVREPHEESARRRRRPGGGRDRQEKEEDVTGTPSGAEP